MSISLFSFFSGVGILDLAFERNRYNIVLVNEYSTQFIEAYKYARQQLGIAPPVYGYYEKSAEYFARKRGKKRLNELMQAERGRGNLVGFIGGPPCPDFSVAGKNRGSEGEHGKLTKTYFDIICRCKPDFFVFENVKGLVRTQKHKHFYDEMQHKLFANDYIISHKLLNALSYGVPQFREREIMVGISKQLFEDLGYQASPDGSFEFPWDEHAIGEVEEILNQPWPTMQRFVANSRRVNRWTDFEELTVNYWFIQNDVCHHPNARDRFAVKAGRAKMEIIAEGDTTRKSFKRLYRWRYSPTACYGNNEVHLHPYKVRRLSVAEAMAIQSLPREFVLPRKMSLSSKFKTIGNGVPYLLSQAIAVTLYDFLYAEGGENPHD